MECIILIVALYIVPIIIIKISNQVYKRVFDKDLIKDSDDLFFTFFPIANIFGAIVFFSITVVWVIASRPESNAWGKVKQVLFKIAR